MGRNGLARHRWTKAMRLRDPEEGGGGGTDGTGGKEQQSQQQEQGGRPEGVSETEWAALGDPGKAALVRERQRAAAAEQRAAERYKDYDALKDKASKYDKALDDAKSEQEKAVEAARREGSEAARQELYRDRVLDKIEVAAAGKFRDVEDARLRLGQRADEFIKDGQIDGKAIAAAVDAVLDAAPHLKAVPDPKRRPDPSQGTRGGETPPGEFGRAEARRRWATQKQ